MTIEPSDVDGLINVSFIISKGDISHLKCEACGKFIVSKWEKFYCPHCHISFLQGIEFKDMEEMDELLDYLKQIEAF